MSGASLLEVQSLTTILPAARGQLTAVSVQREPSGHNLKHPTKWCPPNK